MEKIRKFIKDTLTILCYFTMFILWCIAMVYGINATVFNS